MDTDPPRPDSPCPRVSPALIAPGITALVVAGLLMVARSYDSLPIHPPPCGLRTLTGIPCLACGGTRSMKALAHGDWSGALAYNPLVAVAATGAFLWLAVSAIRHRRPKRPTAPPRSPIPLRWIVAGVIILLAANWAYLICYLPK